MGSVTRRLRRSVWATNMAYKARVRMPPVHIKEVDGTISLFYSKFMPLIFYRATMLRVLRSRRQRDRLLHHQQQSQKGKWSKVMNFFGHFKKSWLRRTLEAIFPSLKKLDREYRKAEREKKRDQYIPPRERTARRTGR